MVRRILLATALVTRHPLFERYPLKLLQSDGFRPANLSPTAATRPLLLLISKQLQPRGVCENFSFCVTILERICGMSLNMFDCNC